MRKVTKRPLRLILPVWGMVMAALLSHIMLEEKQPVMPRFGPMAHTHPKQWHSDSEKSVQYYAFAGSYRDALRALEPELKASGWQRFIYSSDFRSYTKGDLNLTVENGCLSEVKPDPVGASLPQSFSVELRGWVYSPWDRFYERAVLLFQAPPDPASVADYRALERIASWEVSGVAGKNELPYEEVERLCVEALK